MRKSVHSSRPLDPSQPLQQQPAVKLRGLGISASSSSTASRQFEQQHVPDDEEFSRNSEADYHDAYRNRSRNVPTLKFNSASSANSTRSSGGVVTKECEPPQSDDATRYNASSKPQSAKSWNGTEYNSYKSDDEAQSTDLSNIQQDGYTPPNSGSVSKEEPIGRKKYANPSSAGNSIDVPADASDDAPLGSAKVRYSGKRLSKDSIIFRSAKTNVKSTSYNRNNSEAFSSSSNESSSDEEDNNLQSTPGVSRSITDGANSMSRYPRQSSTNAKSATATGSKSTKLQLIASLHSQQQKDDKIATILKHRKLARDSLGTSGGFTSNAAVGSAFDQALEHVKTSSNVVSTTAAASNVVIPAKDGSIKTSSRNAVALQSALHSARRNESGTVVGSLHLQNSPSLSLTAHKTLVQQRGSSNLKDTKSINVSKTNTAFLSNADSMVVDESLNQDQSKSPLCDVQSKKMSEDEQLKSFNNLDDILSFAGIVSEIPVKGRQQPSSSDDGMPALDALASAMMGQKQLQQFKYTVPAAPSASRSTHIATDASSVSSSALETSGTSAALPQTNNSVAAKSGGVHPLKQTFTGPTTKNRPRNEDLASGVLPDVLMTMREKLESLSLFDSDMMKLAQPGSGYYSGVNGRDTFEEETEEERNAKESLQKSFQQSISVAVLVSLAHKRYERRRLGAMEVEKIVRSLVAQNELERVRAILLLLSDDYVRSTSEDARKGGVVALAACEIGLKKADQHNPAVIACKDLILASVVHACQDPNQRVRYYATESLFNVVKVIPVLAVQHFFILFEILRSLYADVDHDVRSGAQLLDKKLKEIIVGAINGGTFHVERCIPLFVRFVYMKNKPTKRLTLTWLNEYSEKLVGNPILEFVHLFLGGVFAMIADPSSSIRQLALGFLQTVLPKLLVSDDEELFEDGNSSFHKVDFDKILQSLVTIMESPDPFVRKVAMYWTNRVVSAHMGLPSDDSQDEANTPTKRGNSMHLDSAASKSVRNSLPHVLPGILLSIGDAYHSRSTTRDAYLFASQTTHSLAEDTNQCLQDVVKRDGKAFVNHLDGFIVTLLEELDSPGGLGSRNAQAIERKPYRMDVKQDGTGIETTGWFRTAAVDLRKNNTGADSNEQYDNMEPNAGSEDSMMIMSRLCALQWIAVLYEYVVPCSLTPDYAREFISPILHQLVHNPPDVITFKSFEVLAKITVPALGENSTEIKSTKDNISRADCNISDTILEPNFDVLEDSRLKLRSRDRSVFAVLIRLYSRYPRLLTELSKVIQFMCTLQPPEFVFISFAVELDVFVAERCGRRGETYNTKSSVETASKKIPKSKDLDFISSFVQQMNVVFLISKETEELRNALKDVIGPRKFVQHSSLIKKKQQLFHVLLHSFAHNLISAISLCLWGGAYLTASLSLHQINALDINLLFFLEVDQLIELLERPLLRHIHLRMLESDSESNDEGCGAMLLRALKSLLMLLPQSTSFNVLRDRLLTVSKYRQSTMGPGKRREISVKGTLTELFVSRLKEVRAMHYTAKWGAVRAESLEEGNMLTSEIAAPDAETKQEENEEQIERPAVGGTILRHPKDNIAHFRPLTNRRLIQQTSKNIAPSSDFTPLKRISRTSSQGLSTDIVDEDAKSSKKWREFWSDVGK